MFNFANLISRFTTTPKPALATRSVLEAGSGGRARWADDRMAWSFATIGQSATKIGARAAYYTLNDPRGVRALEIIVANMVGTGIKPRSEHSSVAVRTRLHRDWKAWSDEADFLAKGDVNYIQSLAVRDMAVYGECLLIFEHDPRTGAPQLRRLHPEQLVWERTFRLPSGGWVQNGVEHDPRGRIVAYWIRPYMPGETIALLSLAPVRVEASEVLHLFRQLMPGQVRGLSWFAPILLNAKDLDALLDAMLVRARLRLCMSGLLPPSTAVHHTMAKVKNRARSM